jgi:adenylate cyclase
LNSVREQQYARGPVSREWLSSPFNALIERSRAGEKNPWLRRRLELGPDQRDFPALVDFYEAGATDYLCLAFAFGESGDPSHGTGVVYSFTTDRPGGFLADEIHLLRSTLPGLSLAMKAHAGYDIASGLLRTYLGNDAGSRVHSGAVERGTVDSLLSVLWYADLRGFTRISDVSSGAAIVHMLNDVFETLTAALRPRGGHVLKFIGDAMLATISFDEPDEKIACRRALDAAVEASSNLKARNLEREAAGLPFADVDIALHVGEVLYGNVGAADRLDFTVIGPAVNEVVRIERLCERLNRRILFSSRFAEAAGRCDGRLESLGKFELRGVGEHKEIFGLRLPPTVALQLGPA